MIYCYLGGDDLCTRSAVHGLRKDGIDVHTVHNHNMFVAFAVDPGKMTSFFIVYYVGVCLDPSKYDIAFWFLVGVHDIICFCERCGGDKFPQLDMFLLLVKVSQGIDKGFMKVLGDVVCRQYQPIFERTFLIALRHIEGTGLNSEAC